MPVASRGANISTNPSTTPPVANMVATTRFASKVAALRAAAKSASGAAIATGRAYDAAVEEATRKCAEAESARAHAHYMEYESEQASITAADTAREFVTLLNSDFADCSAQKAAVSALINALVRNNDIIRAAGRYNAEADEMQRQAEKAASDAADKAQSKDEAALKALELSRRVDRLIGGERVSQWKRKSSRAGRRNGSNCQRTK